jgi:hypothetical protein
MKFYTSMPKGLIDSYEDELNKAKIELIKNNLQQCWRYYERAHILGQRYPLQHSNVHWKMLKFGYKIKSSKEIFGQFTRLIFEGLISFLGA